MEKLMQILKGIKPKADFENNKSLVDEGVLDSLEIIEIITEAEKEYGIEIDPSEIDPDNFQSAESIWNMIQRYLNT